MGTELISSCFTYCLHLPCANFFFLSAINHFVHPMSLFFRVKYFCSDILKAVEFTVWTL